jgi:hypothetical protein
MGLRTVNQIFATYPFRPTDREEAEDLLINFSELTENERKEALPSTIETIFHLIFGEDVAVESSKTYEGLRSKTWQVAPILPFMTSS